MANETTITLTPNEVNDSPLAELVSELETLGPKSVKTKEFEAEQFDPLRVQQLLERRAVHPTFGTIKRVQVDSLRAKEDCG